MTSGCEFVRARLPWLAGEELPALELRTVREHLRDCLACRTEASSLLQARRALQAAGAVSAPAEPFFARLQADIMARVAVEPAPVAIRRARPWSAIRFVAAALVVCALTPLVWSGRAGGLLERRAIPTSQIAVSPYAGPGAQPMVPLGLDVVPDSRSQGMRGRQELRAVVDSDQVSAAPAAPLRVLEQAGVTVLDAARAGIVTGMRPR